MNANKRGQPQWSASGTLAAQLGSAWEALLDTLPMLSARQRGELAQQQVDLKTDANVTTTIEIPQEGRIRLEVDNQEHRIAIQGDWWYRGVYRLIPHADGCHLIYEVTNVAPGVSWWAAQLAQGPQHARTMRAQLQSILNALGERLGCSAALLPAGSQ